jgi:hypothetical protein
MIVETPVSDTQKIHYVRGIAVSIIAAPLFVFFTLNAVAALAATFIGGWLPSQWFSDNPADWFFAFGQEDGAANYFTFMISAMLASASGWAMRWAFTGAS